MQKMLYCISVLIAGYLLGWGFFAYAAKPIDYTYEYKDTPGYCGSGGCNFYIYKNGHQIYNSLTFQRPLIQLEPGASFVPVNTIAHSIHYLKFILFQRSGECEQEVSMPGYKGSGLADCEPIPYLYSNPKYN